jgi:hypothetical protein
MKWLLRASAIAGALMMAATRHRRHRVSLLRLAAFFLAFLFLRVSAAQTTVLFTDDFNGPAFNPALVDIDGTYLFSGGRARNGGQRSYVRTVQNDFAAIDFQADLIYSMGGSSVGNAGVFFGIGAATKDGSFFNEPDASLYLLDHPNGFAITPPSAMVVRVNQPGAGGVSDLTRLASPDGTTYARITKLGDLMTFAFDHTYNGVAFIPDGSHTASLSTVAPFVTTGPSYLFFGTATSPSRFDWIQVSVVGVIPEPETYALLAAGLGLLGFVARRRAAVSTK